MLGDGSTNQTICWSGNIGSIEAKDVLFNVISFFALPVFEKKHVVSKIHVVSKTYFWKHVDNHWTFTKV